MPNAKFDPISCACGCGEMFTPKKRCQIYKTARHKMKAWTIDHPRQRIGVYTTITIGSTKYDLKNPRGIKAKEPKPVIMLAYPKAVKDMEKFLAKEKPQPK